MRPSQRGVEPLTFSFRSSRGIARIHPEVPFEMTSPRPSFLSTISCSKVAKEQDVFERNPFQVTYTGIYGQSTYANMSEDLDTVPPDIPKEELEKYKKVVIQFGDEMDGAFCRASRNGEELCKDLTFMLGPQKIDVWYEGLIYKLGNSLRSLVVHVDDGHNTSRAEAVKRLLFRKANMQSIAIMALQKYAHPERSPPYTHPFSKHCINRLKAQKYWHRN